MDAVKLRAMELAISYCQFHQDADLLLTAKIIYAFLAHEDNWEYNMQIKPKGNSV